MFVQGATLDGSTGDIELSFDDGRTFSFGVAGNGESLAIEPNLWPEQFPEPISPDNQNFILTSGKWEIIDAAESFWSYRRLLGRRLLAAHRLGDNGVRLELDGVAILIEVIADDLHVAFES